VIPADQHIWRLSKCGDQNLALACTEDGLFLGRTPLLERHGGGLLRPRDDIERLLSHAYGPAIGVERLFPGLATTASALSQKNLCLAQIAAVQLRLPDLPDGVTRDGLEAEDRLIKRARSNGGLARATWDDAQHPRTGVPLIPAGLLRRTAQLHEYAGAGRGWTKRSARLGGDPRSNGAGPAGDVECSDCAAARDRPRQSKSDLFLQP
jgi:hypothetical protein